VTDLTLHLADGCVYVGQHFYWYNAGTGKIVKQLYKGEHYFRKRFIMRRAGCTPERAAMLGRKHARSLSGVARVERALKDYLRGT
jgi:hypothetical protein